MKTARSKLPDPETTEPKKRVPRGSLLESQWPEILGSRGWAVTMAKRTLSREDLDDRIQEAMLNMCLARLSWDENGAAKFNTYVTTAIRWGMYRFYSVQLIKIPAGQKGPACLVGERFFPAQRKRRLIRDDDDNDGGYLPRDVPAPDSVSPHEVDVSEMARVINLAMRSLPYKHRIAIELHYGLNGHEPMTLKEIGKIMKVTAEVIRQREARGICRLAQWFEFNHIRFEDLIDDEN